MNIYAHFLLLPNYIIIHFNHVCEWVVYFVLVSVLVCFGWFFFGRLVVGGVGSMRARAYCLETGERRGRNGRIMRNLTTVYVYIHSRTTTVILGEQSKIDRKEFILSLSYSTPSIPNTSPVQVKSRSGTSSCVSASRLWGSLVANWRCHVIVWPEWRSAPSGHFWSVVRQLGLYLPPWPGSPSRVCVTRVCFLLTTAPCCQVSLKFTGSEGNPNSCHPSQERQSTEKSYGSWHMYGRFLPQKLFVCLVFI